MLRFTHFPIRPVALFVVTMLIIVNPHWLQNCQCATGNQIRVFAPSVTAGARSCGSIPSVTTTGCCERQSGCRCCVENDGSERGCNSNGCDCGCSVVAAPVGVLTALDSTEKTNLSALALKSPPFLQWDNFNPFQPFQLEESRLSDPTLLRLAKLCRWLI